MAHHRGDVCFTFVLVIKGTFFTIPAVENYLAGFFCSCPNLDRGKAVNPGLMCHSACLSMCLQLYYLCVWSCCRWNEHRILLQLWSVTNFGKILSILEKSSSSPRIWVLTRVAYPASIFGRYWLVFCWYHTSRYQQKTWLVDFGITPSIWEKM